MPSPTPSVQPQALITWGKAIASQLIVWHHLARYGPLADALSGQFPALSAWLVSQARMAVQVFIVVGGFLAARSLWPAPVTPQLGPAGWLSRVAQRWRRLWPVYALALSLAVLAAAVARIWMQNSDTPGVPTLGQLLANAFMLQDVLRVPALSAGIWYVAIDLQLFALLAALAALTHALQHGRVTRATKPNQATDRPIDWLPLCIVVPGVAASLWWWNRDPSGNAWAPYFFGAYGLGVLAAWGQRCDGPSRLWWAALIAGLAAMALVVGWRSRVALAAATALVLLWQPGSRMLAKSHLHPIMAWLAKVAYPVFLVHYPVALLLNATATRIGLHHPWAQMAALLLAWLISLALGWLVWRCVESRPWANTRGTKEAVTPALQHVR